MLHSSGQVTLILAPGLLLLAPLLGLAAGGSKCNKWQNKEDEDKVNSEKMYDPECEFMSKEKKGCFVNVKSNRQHCVTYKEFHTVKGPQLKPKTDYTCYDINTNNYNWDDYVANGQAKNNCAYWPPDEFTVVMKQFPDGSKYWESKQPSDPVKEVIRARWDAIVARMMSDQASASRRISSDSDMFVAVPWKVLAEAQSPNKLLDNLIATVKEKMLQKKPGGKAASLVESGVSTSQPKARQLNTGTASSFHRVRGARPTSFAEDSGHQHAGHTFAQGINTHTELSPLSGTDPSSYISRSEGAEASGHQHTGHTFVGASADALGNQPDQNDPQAQGINTHTELSPLRDIHPTSHASRSEGAEDSGQQHRGHTFVTASHAGLENPADQNDPEAQQIQTRVDLSSLRGTHPTSDASRFEGPEDSGHQHTVVSASADALGNQPDQSDHQAQHIQTHVDLSSLRGTHPTSFASRFEGAEDSGHQHTPDQSDHQAQLIQTHVALSSLRGTDPASYISGSEGAEDSGGVHQQMGHTFVTAPADVLGNQLDQSDPQAQQIQTHVALSSLRGTHPTSDASGSEGAEDSGGHQHAGNTFARMQSPNKILDTVSAEINAEMHQETTGASSLVEGGIRMSQRKARRLNRRADLSSPRGTRPTSSASGSEGAEDSGGHQHTGHNFVTAPADALENQPDQSDSQVGDASPRSAAETAALPGL